MDTHAMLQALTELAGSLELGIRRVPAAGQSGEHPGGAVVKIRGRQVVFLDSTAPVADQVGVVVEALRGRAELENMFLPPEIREILERTASDG